MGRVFADLDDLHGGGHARPVASAYLTREVAPLLRGTVGRFRPALLTVTAEILYLLGWMAADELKPAVARRHYLQAVQLADEAGDPAMRSTALRSLAVQAVELGEGTRALDLAEAARAGLPPKASPRKYAWVSGMCAEATAASGASWTSCSQLLREAERGLDRADSAAGSWSDGGYRRESFEHQVGLVLTQLGDFAGAERHFRASVAARRPVERRTRALVGVRLATAQLKQRHPDDAAATLLDLRDDLSNITSAKVTRHLSGIREAWVPYRSEPLVQQADHMLRGFTPSPA